ncbi:hypothetical protein F444_18615 [Phytophthora nicotianae P1976]|uniref:Uncharacterized protein n=1 Tax=Phytophthora nicotianae P1976 TaxID=1317066 RepID=A0A080ZAT7_PHYNI|nr:hypothetical protein F444_18615 [Phytophthora nicotianae P1976]
MTDTLHDSEARQLLGMFLKDLNKHATLQLTPVECKSAHQGVQTPSASEQVNPAQTLAKPLPTPSTAHLSPKRKKESVMVTPKGGAGTTSATARLRQPRQVSGYAEDDFLRRATDAFGKGTARELGFEKSSQS